LTRAARGDTTALSFRGGIVVTAYRSRIALALALVVLLLAPTLAVAQQPSKSAALAAELATLLDQNKLDSIAVKAADQYVGALYFPGSQLLVVQAKYSAPDRMNYLLTQKAYRDVYIDLNSASEQQSKIFVSDLGANGLRFKRENNQPFDSVDMAGKSIAFDGDWGKARISEADYTKSYQASDEQYSQMLQALISALKKPS
jgi:hypothetical protein